MASLLARRRTRRSLGVATVALAAVGAWVAFGGGAEPYVPGEHTEGLTDSLGRRLPEDHPPLVFQEISGEAGLVFHHAPFVRSNRLPEDMGSGVALADVDADGDTDAYLVNTHALGDEHPGDDTRCRLYANQGDGHFQDITAASGTGLKIMGMAAGFFDSQGDGQLDLFLSSYGRCLLLGNDGRARFTDRSEQSGVAGEQGFWTGLAFGDPDLDGDVDVYVCGYVRYDENVVDPGSTASQYDSDIPALINPSVFEAERNLLFVNRGDGVFDEGAREAGVAGSGGRSLGAGFCDLTGDGVVDLYVANDVSDNVLYVNRGDGTFDDLTARALVGDYRGAMGLAFGDVDGDLDPDLFITHWVAQENALYMNIRTELADAGSGPPAMFMDEADRHGLGQIALPMVGWSASMQDFDEDGVLDLHVSNGSTIPRRDERSLLIPQRDQIFWNAGESRGFFELGDVAGPIFDRETVSRGGAAFDLELDGDPDLLELVRGDGVLLLRNDTPLAGRHALVLRLRQPVGNTFALGARVELRSGGTTQVRWVGSQGSYLSQHAVGEVRFGLGPQTLVDELAVTWPDGTRETQSDLPADQLLDWTRGRPPRREWLPGRVAAWRASSGTPPSDNDARRRFHKLMGEAADRRIADEPAAAAALYTQALEIWPGHDDGLYYLANCELEQGHELRAADLFDLLVQIHPRSSRAWMQRGRLALPGGDPACDDLDLARSAYERAHSINGEETGPVVQLGLVALLAGDHEQAARRFAEAARTNARDVPSRYYGGYLAWKRGEREQAQQLLSEARAAAAGQLGLGSSASAEGDTKSGGALTARSAEGHGQLSLDRWRSLGQREGGPDQEYAPLDDLLP